MFVLICIPYKYINLFHFITCSHGQRDIFIIDTWMHSLTITNPPTKKNKLQLLRFQEGDTRLMLQPVGQTIDRATFKSS